MNKYTNNPNLDSIQLHRDDRWSPAFYDDEDDEVYTIRVYEIEGKAIIETVSLSPLGSAHIIFDDYPALHSVIFEAQDKCNGRHPRDVPELQEF